MVGKSTELDAMREALDAMEEPVEFGDMLFEYLPVPVLMTDEFLTIIGGNSCANRLTGLPSDMLGKKPFNLGDWVGVKTKGYILSGSGGPVVALDNLCITTPAYNGTACLRIRAIQLGEPGYLAVVLPMDGGNDKDL